MKFPARHGAHKNPNDTKGRNHANNIPAPRPEIDADGLLEYSVVYTDRSLNHMSQKFQTALRYISATLKKVYRAQHAAVVPGTGTVGDRKSVV